MVEFLAPSTKATNLFREIGSVAWMLCLVLCIVTFDVCWGCAILCFKLMKILYPLFVGYILAIFVDIKRAITMVMVITRLIFFAVKTNPAIQAFGNAWKPWKVCAKFIHAKLEKLALCASLCVIRVDVYVRNRIVNLILVNIRRLCKLIFSLCWQWLVSATGVKMWSVTGSTKTAHSASYTVIGPIMTALHNPRDVCEALISITQALYNGGIACTWKLFVFRSPQGHCIFGARIRSAEGFQQDEQVYEGSQQDECVEDLVKDPRSSSGEDSSPSSPSQ